MGIPQVFILPILSATDLIFTFSWFYKYQKQYPEDKQWGRFEQNQLIKWAWRKFGFKKGSVISGIITFIVWILLTLSAMSIKDGFYIGLFAGIFSFVVALHIHNFGKLKKKDKR
jgi:uncharacterized membrane protein YkgB